MRFLIIVGSLLFVLSCGSGSQCNAVNCFGCCNANGLCESGNSTSACGKMAETCSACTGALTCQAGTCTMFMGSGGGVGGGGAGAGGGSGGGTGAGGGVGGGSAGGAGGGSAGGAGGGSAGGAGGGSSTTDGGLTTEQKMLLAARPYNLQVPTGYDGGMAVPLVVLLHGYGANGLQQSLYFQFPALANANNFLLATPDGLLDGTAKRYWNATNACCDIFGTGVDDVKYLTAVLDDAAIKYRVNPKRVYFVGHSNGGFMSHRMACDKGERIAAIVSLAGANFKNISSCVTSAPVAVLQVHGTADATILFDGGTLGGAAGPLYPGAPETVQGWAVKNGCGIFLSPLPGAKDLDSAVAGMETTASAFTCANGAAELWTMQNSGHIPTFNSNWATEVWTFLNAHPKP